MGLVQLFRDNPCPDILARRLLLAVLADLRETGHHYLLHLVQQRERAWAGGTVEEIASLDAQIREHGIHQQIPARWQLDFLFSKAGYDTYGDGLALIWTVTLIRLCVLEQYWEDVLLGCKPLNPYLLPGFHPDEDVYSTEWLEDFRPSWKQVLEDVQPGDSVHMAAAPLPVSR